MTVTLPSTGKADWTDYEDFWREADAEWIQERIVLRVTTAERDNPLLGLTTGAVIYNVTKEKLEWKKPSGFQTLEPLPGTLTTAETTSPNKTTISHVDAGGKGLVFSAGEIGITADKLDVLGVLTVAATGVTIKTGAKTAKFTTDATNLVSDTPVSVPGLAVTAGAIAASGRAATVGSLVSEGAVTAVSVSATGAVNGGSGTIGGVVLTGNKATASAGFDSGSGGSFYGDASWGYMRHSTRLGSYLRVNASRIEAREGEFDVYSSMRLVGSAASAIIHQTSGKTITPSFYSATTPDPALYPEGTIWIN